MSRRFAGWCIYLVILCGAFALPLREFIAYARHSEVHSYVLLIPFVTAYLLYLRWTRLSHELSSSWGFALLLAAGGIGALLASQHFGDLGQNDYMTVVALSFVCFVISGQEVGALCHVPTFFPRLYDPIAGGSGGFARKRIEGSFGGGSELVVSHQRHPVFAQRNALSASRNNYHGGQRM